MTPELIGIITVGIALAGQNMRLSSRIEKVEQEVAFIKGLLSPKPPFHVETSE